MRIITVNDVRKNKYNNILIREIVINFSRVMQMFFRICYEITVERL